jgi:DNA-binding IclR family transcriptional regulator
MASTEFVHDNEQIKADELPAKRYHVQAVDRAGQVLLTLAAANQPMNLTEIAQAVHLSPATVLRMLRTLQELDLVQSIEEGNRYLLGFGILRMAQALVRQLDIVRVAERFLVAMRDESGENSGLDFRDGDFWVSVASIPARQRISVTSHIGDRRQLYTGASGKVLLSGFADTDIEAYVRRTPLLPLSPTTLITAEALWEQIHQVRALGYAVSLNERGEGGASVSAPVFDHTGKVAAAIKISGVVTRFTEDRVQIFIPIVKRVASELSHALGYNQM